MDHARDGMLLVARLLLAALFLPSGIEKLLAFSAFAASLADKGLPYPEVWAAAAVAIEVLGPIALVLGAFPRLSALALMAFVIAAIATSHRFWESAGPARKAQEINFLKNVGILGGLLLYFVSGSGGWSWFGGTRREHGTRVVSPESGQPPAQAGMRTLELISAWGNVATGLGTVVAVITLAFGLREFSESQDRWRKEVATRAVFESGADQPFISQHCLGAIRSLDDDTLLSLHARRETVALGGEQTECVRRCFADLKPQDRAEVYVGDRTNVLSAKGAALLAQRANMKLDKDELVANLVIQKIGDEKLLTSVFGPRICNLDKEIVATLRRIGRDSKIDEWMTAYKPILDFSERGFCKDVEPEQTFCAK